MWLVITHVTEIAIVSEKLAMIRPWERNCRVENNSLPSKLCFYFWTIRNLQERTRRFQLCDDEKDKKMRNTSITTDLGIIPEVSYTDKLSQTRIYHSHWAGRGANPGISTFSLIYITITRIMWTNSSKTNIQKAFIRLVNSLNEN